jgi:nucleotide-binding universal stress UspA family protein
MTSLVLPGAVVVGVDGSASSDIALGWAVACAQDHRRPLAIVHAAGVAVVTDFGIPLEQLQRGRRLAGQGVVDHALALVRKADTSLRVSVHLELREPRELLMEVAGDVARWQVCSWVR